MDDPGVVRIGTLLLAGMVSWAPSLHAQPLPDERTSRPPFRVAVSTLIDGEFSALTCNDATVTLDSVAANLAGERDALAVDAGDLLGVSAVARLTVDHFTAAMAAAIQATGLRVLAVGHRDLASVRASFLEAARALGSRGIHHVLSNLHCDETHRALCEVVLDGDDPPMLLDAPWGRVAVVSLVAPAALQRVAADRAEGLTLDPIADAMPAQVTAARAAGADRVVVTLDPSNQHELEDVLALANAAEPGAAPDVIVVNALPGGLSSLETNHAGIPVVAARAGTVTVVQPDEPVRARPARSGPVPDAVRQFTTASTHWLCGQYQHTLPGGQLTSALSRRDLGALVMDVLRDTTRAEVGFINNGAVRGPRGLFPLRHGISQLDVAAALAFDDTIEVATVRGEALRTMITAAVARNMIMRGAVVADDDAVTINGRPLDDEQSYRVVTTGYIAGGGDGLLGEHPPEFSPAGSQTMQEVFLSWLSVPRSDDARAAVIDPALHVRWHLNWSVDASFTSVDIVNPSSRAVPAAYSDSQLTRAEAATLRIDSDFRADADHPDYLLENDLRVQYGQQRTIPVGGSSTGYTENLNLVTERTALTLHTFHGDPRWYYPQPYGEAFTETELPTQLGTGHLEVRPSVGARFALLDRLAFNAGAGLDWELGTPVPGDAQVAFIAGLALKEGRIFGLGGRAVLAQGGIEVTVRNPWNTSSTVTSDLNQASVTLRANAHLTVPLFEPVALTLGYDVFARSNVGAPWGIAGDALVGIRVTLDHSIQTF